MSYVFQASEAHEKPAHGSLSVAGFTSGSPPPRWPSGDRHGALGPEQRPALRLTPVPATGGRIVASTAW